MTASDDDDGYDTRSDAGSVALVHSIETLPDVPEETREETFIASSHVQTGKMEYTAYSHASPLPPLQNLTLTEVDTTAAAADDENDSTPRPTARIATRRIVDTAGGPIRTALPPRTSGSSPSRSPSRWRRSLPPSSRLLAVAGGSHRRVAAQPSKIRAETFYAYLYS